MNEYRYCAITVSLDDDNKQIIQVNGMVLAASLSEAHQISCEMCIKAFAKTRKIESILIEQIQK